MKIVRSPLLSLLVLLLLFHTGGLAMSLSDIGKVCLFSGISGQIFINGKPVSNAHVKRIVDKAFSGGKKMDETNTDHDGRFSMPAVFERTASKYLPQEFAVGQQILVYHNEQEYELWAGVKRSPEENTEASGKPLVVACELNSGKNHITVGGGPIISLCRWEVEADKVVPLDQLPGPGEG